MPLVLAQLVGLVLGLLFGSFLNVCITRVPLGESVTHPRSRCTTCGHSVRWFDNVPLLSWIILRRRCRDCRAVISWRYPAVELAVGLWFAGTATMLWIAWNSYSAGTPGATFEPIASSSVDALGVAALGFLLIGLIVIDWQTQRLPDVLTLGGMAFAFLLICLKAVLLGPTENQLLLTHNVRLSSPGSSAATGNLFLTGPEALIFGRVAAAAGAALLLLLVRWGYKALRKRDGLGLGDVKMLAMVAAFLGFGPAILTLFAGVLLASIYGTVLLLRGRANALTRLPLGSFLGAAGLFVALFGQRIFTWYFSLFSSR